MSNYIKSPLNFVGGKYKLLPQILPLFPRDIDIFVDLFAGGFNVGVNINADKIICNDLDSHLINLFRSLSTMSSGKALKILRKTINKYNLSKTNEEGFLKLREDFNSGKRDWNMFYALITHAFNYQIRYNKQGEYNMPFGRNRSSFNPSLEEKFIKFVKALNSKNIEFMNKDFRQVNLDSLTSKSLVYCDPPYLLGCASYNENGGWNEEIENQLFKYLDKLNNKNIKFALSNVLEHKGKSNILLKNWSKKYNIHYLKSSYENCNYQTKNNNDTIEVLITNY